MAITFNPQMKMASRVSFKQNEDTKVATPPADTAPTKTPPPAVDVVQKQEEAPKQKGVSNFASKVAYGWINATKMTKGALLGIFAGATAGTAVAGADWLVSGTKKAFKAAKVEEIVKDVAKDAAKVEDEVVSKNAEKLEKVVVKFKFAKFASGVKTMFKHPTKVLGAVGKFAAPAVALAVFAGNVISARLDVNKKTANVDHQLYTNHRADKK